MRKNASHTLTAIFVLSAAIVVGWTSAPVLAGDDSDPGLLRRRIVELGRSEVDDARFRHGVEELLGVKMEPVGMVKRLMGTFNNGWVLFGLAAQALFMMRFVIQWIASERRKRSYVPVAFWWLSLAGGISLLTYACHRRDPVFMLGQALGCIIYARNLVLIYGKGNGPSAGPGVKIVNQ